MSEERPVQIIQHIHTHEEKKTSFWRKLLQPILEFAGIVCAVLLSLLACVISPFLALTLEDGIQIPRIEPRLWWIGIPLAVIIYGIAYFWPLIKARFTKRR